MRTIEQTYSFFKFLNERENIKIPLKAKLLYDPESITEEDLIVEGDLDLFGIQIRELPNIVLVKGSLILDQTPIEELPDNLTVEEYLGIQASKIQTLPDNLTVGKTLFMDHTNIQSFPNNLIVKGSLEMHNTPLGANHSKEEIRKMIEDKGGTVRGQIWK